MTFVTTNGRKQNANATTWARDSDAFPDRNVPRSEASLNTECGRPGPTGNCGGAWQIVKNLQAGIEPPRKTFRVFTALPTSADLLEFCSKSGMDGRVTAENIDWEFYSTGLIGSFFKKKPLTLPAPPLSRAIAFVRRTGTEYCFNSLGDVPR